MKTALILPPLMLIAATPLFAASPFDGTWKADYSKMKFSAKPDKMLLTGGTFTCPTCLPPYTVAADGAFHAIKGHAYSDAVAIKMVDPHTIMFSYRKAGKVNGTEINKVSPDGRTLTVVWSGKSPTNGVETRTSSTATRVAPAPAGAHAISGSWQAVAVQSASDSAMTQTMKVDGDMLMWSAPTGESYAARFGGPVVMQKGDPGKTMISVKQPAPTASSRPTCGWARRSASTT